MLMRLLYLFVIAILTACVDINSHGSKQADEAAVRWAEAYFNYDFNQAQRLTTSDSHKWLRFVATNLTEQDLEVIRQQDEPAHVKLIACDIESDSTWTAVVEVNNYVFPDSIGQPAELVEDSRQFKVSVVRQDGRMFVRMKGVPRPTSSVY
jgi:hypothetical protein